MVKNLLLIRHAEAEFPSEQKRDFERRLTQNGKNQATILGAYLKKRAFAIDGLYHSPAFRTIETAEAIINAVDNSPRLMDAEELYEATGNLMKAFVNRLDDNFQNLAIIAHNPGISELHNYLTQEFETYATATCAILELDIDSWSNLSGNMAITKDLYYPGMIDE